VLRSQVEAKVALQKEVSKMRGEWFVSLLIVGILIGCIGYFTAVAAEPIELNLPVLIAGENPRQEVNVPKLITGEIAPKKANIPVFIAEISAGYYSEEYSPGDLWIDFERGKTVVLSGKDDGTGDILVRNSLEIKVTHPSGGVATRAIEFCTKPSEEEGTCECTAKSPEDITSMFAEGANRVSIILWRKTDICPGGWLESDSL